MLALVGFNCTVFNYPWLVYPDMFSSARKVERERGTAGHEGVLTSLPLSEPPARTSAYKYVPAQNVASA